MHRDRKSREERAEQNGIVIPEEDRLKEQVNVRFSGISSDRDRMRLARSSPPARERLGNFCDVHANSDDTSLGDPHADRRLVFCASRDMKWIPRI